MNNFFRGIIAAWGAKKLGGGCLSTIVIFVIIYTLLGKCGNGPARTQTAVPQGKVKAVAVCQVAVALPQAGRLRESN